MSLNNRPPARSLIVYGNDKIYVDNSALIRDKVLKFKSPDDFYLVSVLWRKKDHPECHANENARMIANWYIKSVEYFDRKLPIIKDYCEHFGARAYIKPQVRSCLGTNRQILRFMAEQIDNQDLSYGTLTREIISGYHQSRDKRIVLDLDKIDDRKLRTIFNAIYQQISVVEGRPDDASKMFWLQTFDGYHIITPGFNPNFLEQFNLPKDAWHPDNDTLLYAVKPK